MHRWQIILRTILLAAMVLGVSRGHAATVAEKLTEGSVSIAAGKLAADPDDKSGRRLLAFALAVSPENENALLMQARLDRGLKIETPAKSANVGEFAAFIEKTAERTKARGRQLLLYRVLEMLSPLNKAALIELTKAKNEGIDTNFEALLAQLNPSAAPDVGQDVLPGGDDTVIVSPAGPGADKIRMAIREERLSPSVLRAGTMAVICHINESILKPMGASLVYKSTRLPASSYESYTTGTHYSSSSGLGYAIDFRHAIAPSSDYEQVAVTAADWLAEVAAVFGLKVTYTDRSLEITDAAEPGVSGREAIWASALYEESTRRMLDFIKKYRGKRILVKGKVESISRNMGDTYVAVADGNVRIMLGKDVASWRKERIKNRARYNGWVIYAIGECTGTSGGRVIIDNCRFVGW